MIGQTISHYKILEKLGSGGMGVVYKAVDTKLDRFVALKFLPQHLSENEVEKQRFIHEAKAASALDHPNICVIHEIGETDDGQLFICMAYYDGETLAKKVASNQLSVNSVIEVVTQIANGLAKAHQHGITHRDIKPANVMITKDGVVKVLDFGLAKLAGRAKLTKTGTTMGTAAYMSPEQVQRMDADHRTDIWSLGVVMYEMLTGQLPFEGEYEQAVMYAIVNMEPVLVRSLKSEVPVDLESIVHKALAKEPEERYQSIAELQNDLKLNDEPQKIARKLFAPAPQELRKKKRMLWMVAPAMFAAAGVIWFYFFSPFLKPALPPIKTIPFTSLPGIETNPAFSPDGRQIAFRWKNDIYLQLVGTTAPLQITKSPRFDFSPTWSSDGRYIAFDRTYSDTSGAIMIVPALGGTERELYPVKFDFSVKAPNLRWSPDGKWFAFSESDSSQYPWCIFLLAAEGLEKRKLTSPPQNYLGDIFCAFSPDSKMLAVVREFSANADDIFIVPIMGGESKQLTFDKQNIIGLTWTPNGKDIIFSSDRDGNQRLWRITVSGGVPEPLDAYGVRPAISSQGQLLAYYQRIADPDIWRIDLAGAKGKATAPYKFVVSTRFDVAPLISPDQTKIVFASGRTGRAEIWRCDSSGRNLLQLTHLGSNDTSPGSPRWFPDSKFIAFDAGPEGQSDIYVASAEGGMPRRLTNETSEDFVPSWSWDGRWIYFTSNRSGDFQIWKMPVQGDPATARQVTKHGGHAVHESLDGKWLYFVKKPFGSIWKMPVKGDKESLVLDVSVEFGSVAFVREGFYYFDDKTGPASIKFFDFATQDATTVTVLNDPLALLGISASLDRRWLLYSQRHFEGDIMLVENFR